MKIALITGCARSGTSILGELAGAHPAVKYIYEAHEVWEIGGAGPDGSHRLTAEAATPEVVGEIRAWFERERGGAEWIIEKCPRNALRVPYLRAIFPEAKLIHIIRDGRDVTCSLMPGIGGAEWRHLKPENWRELYALPPVERCARTWREVVETALEDLAADDSARPASEGHLEVRYERVVSDPADVARDLGAHLGLPPAAEMNEFCEKIADRTEGSYAPQGASRNWNRADHDRRVGRWRENLSPDDQATVLRILGPLLARLGYDES